MWVNQHVFFFFFFFFFGIFWRSIWSAVGPIFRLDVDVGLQSTWCRNYCFVLKRQVLVYWSPVWWHLYGTVGYFTGNWCSVNISRQRGLLSSMVLCVQKMNGLVIGVLASKHGRQRINVLISKRVWAWFQKPVCFWSCWQCFTGGPKRTRNTNILIAGVLIFFWVKVFFFFFCLFGKKRRLWWYTFSTSIRDKPHDVGIPKK